MSRARVSVLAVLFVVLLSGCSESPAEAGEEYGSTVVNSDPDVTCVVEAVHRYRGSDEDSDAFLTACKERAKR